MDTLGSKRECPLSLFPQKEILVLFSAALLFSQLAILIAWGVACWPLHIRYVLPLGIDFRVFWGASLLSLTHGPLAAFDPQLLHAAEKVAFSTSSLDPKFAPWVYPPTFQLLVYPLALVSYPIAYVLFACFSLIACVAACARLMKARPLPWITFLAFPGIWVVILQGQNTLITLALAAVAIGVVRTRPVLAGVFAGMLIIKPQLAPVFPLMFLCGRHFRALLVTALTMILMCTVSTIAFGVPLWAAFVRAVLQFNATTLTHSDTGIWLAMPTFFALSRRMGMNVEAAYMVHYAAVLVALVVSMRIWIKHPNSEMGAAATIVTALMLPPYLIYYELAWLLLPIIYLCRNSSGHAVEAATGHAIVAVSWVIPIIAFLTGWFHVEQWATFLLPALLALICHRSRSVDSNPCIGRRTSQIPQDCVEDRYGHA
ncbi:glycosyltransferase family 87 protein [Paraburkholderia heleia]|uniref:glycosyltransferase family 87 protein n=1 Tax=Paraburkholderia heleia TaxID=634127 RepID=UPI002AB7278D|nr:glycosyltransferase family 87 protein [Paraburkholderia heleia]